ncbi:LysR substrate-binding domain-containing protein [Streptomyces sp. NPDC058861]|uniref:LysR substrate-binding domain-containing protein n=1 Tax=Streptomyces sp. NPDC058861 TaxID=3346653 RepID=UPI00369F488D
MRPRPTRPTTRPRRPGSASTAATGVRICGSTVSSPPGAAILLTAAADALFAAHPGCEVTVREVTVHEVPLDGGVRALLDGTLDVQLATLPVREPGLTTGPVVLRDDRALLLPAAHPLAGRPSLGPEDLAACP